MRGHPIKVRPSLVPIKEWLGKGNSKVQVALPSDAKPPPNQGSAQEWAIQALGLETDRIKDLVIQRGTDQEPVLVCVEVQPEEMVKMQTGEATFQLPWESNCRGIYVVNPDVGALDVEESTSVYFPQCILLKNTIWSYSTTHFDWTLISGQSYIAFTTVLQNMCFLPQTVRDSDFSLGWCDFVWRVDSKRLLRRNVPTYPRYIEKTGTTAPQLF